MLLRESAQEARDGGGKRRSVENGGLEPHGVKGRNRGLWLDLVRVYEQLGQEDAPKGIWSLLASEGGARAELVQIKLT